MRTPLLFLLTFSLSMFASSIASADWFHDFDGIANDPVTAWKVPDSNTFQTDYEHTVDGTNKMFRAWETRTGAEGGTTDAGVRNPNTESIVDVRVAATINPALNTDDSLGLAARNVSYGNFYMAGVNFTTGGFFILKIESVDTVHWLRSGKTVEDLSRSYYMELDVVGTEEPRLTARLFDERGGTLLQSIAAVDDGSFGGGSYSLGQAATWSTVADGVLDVSFDDISAITIPEPSSALLTALGLLGLTVWRRRRSS
jgi:hypothetical protein